MPTRNTVVLRRIVEVLGDAAPPNTLQKLEAHFQSSLLVLAGDTHDVATHAEMLRLAITSHECDAVLDYLGQAAVIHISIDHVEAAINTLFEDRFIEP